MIPVFDWREYIKINPDAKNKRSAIESLLKSRGQNLSNVKYNNNCIVNQRDKLVFLWSLRAASAVVCQAAFETMGVLSDALQYNSFIHKYRKEVYLKTAIHINDVVFHDDYRVIKVVRNPYDRAVSLLRIAHNYGVDCTFRELMTMLKNKTLKIHNIVGHAIPQYLENEELYIDYYVKIENPDVTKIYEDTGVRPDFEKKSIHHTVKTDYTNNQFFGDIRFSEIKIMPSNYRLFYDTEIKKLVDELYATDISKYDYQL